MAWLALLIACLVFVVVSIKGQASELSLPALSHSQHLPLHSGARAMRCHQCHSNQQGERCIDLPINETLFARACTSPTQECMVKRFSYTTSTENATSNLHVWSVERNCSSRCEPGTLVLGERTKLYVFTSCCNEDLCNVGSGASSSLLSDKHFLVCLCLLSFIGFKELIYVFT